VLKFNLCLIVFLLVSLPLDSRALDNGPIDGRVIDSVTKQPIAGSIVVAKWTRSEGVIVHSDEVCNHVATAVTDSQGRYHFDKWRYSTNPVEWLFVAPYSMSLDAYKPGMEIVRSPVKKMVEMTGILQLKPWSGTRAERAGWLRARISSGELDCGNSAETEYILRPVRDVIFAEATCIATANIQDQEAARRVDFIQRSRGPQKLQRNSGTAQAPTASSITPQRILLPPPVVSPAIAR
jgi:hypothetical protein